jgi:hypothetical protein
LFNSFSFFCNFLSRHSYLFVLNLLFRSGEAAVPARSL